MPSNGTVARTLPQLFGDTFNVKGDGATLSGASPDAPFIQAAYNALPTRVVGGITYGNSVLNIGNGLWYGDPTPISNGTNQIVYNALGGSLYQPDGITPVYSIGDGDTLAAARNGSVVFSKTFTGTSYLGSLGANDPNTTNSAPLAVVLNLNNPSASNSFVPWAFSVVSNTSPTNHGYVFGVVHTLNSNSNRDLVNQEVGIVSRVNRTGLSTTFNFFGTFNDFSGRQTDANSAYVLGEYDCFANGPDPESGRQHALFTNNVQTLNGTWAGNTPYAVGAVIVVTPAGKEPVTYLCTTSGVTSNTQPTWTLPTYPNVPTFTDGSVVWTYGTVASRSAMDRSIIIQGPMPYNTPILVFAPVLHSVFDTTLSTLYGDADIARHAPDQYVNFGVAAKPIQWLPNHSYAAGSLVIPNDNNGYTFFTSTAGTSGSVEPTFSTSAPVTDGGCTWARYYVGARLGYQSSSQSLALVINTTPGGTPVTPMQIGALGAIFPQGVIDSAVNLYVPATSASAITIPNQTTWFIYSPTTTASTLVITFPAFVQNGQPLHITFDKPVANLSFAFPSGSGAVGVFPTSAAAGDTLYFRAVYTGYWRLVDDNTFASTSIQLGLTAPYLLQSYSNATAALAAYSPPGSGTSFAVNMSGFGGGTLSSVGTQNSTSYGIAAYNPFGSGQTGSFNTAYGYGALNSPTCSNNNVAIGVGAAACLIGGTGTGQNVAVGITAMQNATIDVFGTGIGSNAGKAWQGTRACTAVGHGAMGQSDGFMGQPAIAWSTAFYNTAIGTWSQQFNTSGQQNTALGVYSLWTNTTGQLNTAVGYSAMMSANATTGATGSYNTAVGSNSLAGITSGSNNIALGTLTGAALGATNDNVFIGYSAGYGGTTNTQSLLDLQCVFIGSGATRDNSVSQSTAISNSMALGYGATVAASNTIVLGNSSVTTLRLGGAAGQVIGGPFAAANAFGLTAGTTLRSASARAGDALNPADAGAVFNGTTDDTPYINGAIAALPSTGGFLNYPAGAKIVATGSLTQNGLVIHKLNGATAGTSGVVLTTSQGGMGKDMFVTANNGHILFARAVANSTNSGLLNMVDNMANLTGTGAAQTLNIQNTVTGTAGTSAGVLTAGVTTIVNTTQHGTYVSLGAAMTKGTLSTTPFAGWGMVITASDTNVGPSSTYGALTGLEIDMAQAGPDDGGSASGLNPNGNGLRSVLYLDGGNGQSCTVANTQVATGLNIVNSGRDSTGTPYTTFGTLNPNSSYKNFIQMTGYASISALDLSGVLPLSVSGQPAYQAIRIAANQPIAFDASIISTGRVAGAHTLMYNSSTSEWQLSSSGTPEIRFGAAGGVGFFGTAAPTSKPTFTGAKGSNAALASVIAALVAAGFAADSTTT